MCTILKAVFIFIHFFVLAIALSAQEIEAISNSLHITFNNENDSIRYTLGIGRLPDERLINGEYEPTLRAFLALDKFSKENPKVFPFQVLLTDSPSGVDYYVSAKFTDNSKDLYFNEIKVYRKGNQEKLIKDTLYCSSLSQQELRRISFIRGLNEGIVFIQKDVNNENINHPKKKPKLNSLPELLGFPSKTFQYKDL
jgi:hypothetical protein